MGINVGQIKSDDLEKLVQDKQLKQYRFNCFNDTGQDPYFCLELVFLNGTKMVVIPEGKSDHVHRIGLYFSKR